MSGGGDGCGGCGVSGGGDGRGGCGVSGGGDGCGCRWADCLIAVLVARIRFRSFISTRCTCCSIYSVEGFLSTATNTLRSTRIAMSITAI